MHAVREVNLACRPRDLGIETRPWSALRQIALNQVPSSAMKSLLEQAEY